MRSPTRGLAQIKTPTGTIIGYSTAPEKLRKTALVTIVLMLILLEAINTPGLSIEQVLKILEFQ